MPLFENKSVENFHAKTLSVERVFPVCEVDSWIYEVALRGFWTSRLTAELPDVAPKGINPGAITPVSVAAVPFSEKICNWLSPEVPA